MFVVTHLKRVLVLALAVSKKIAIVSICLKSQTLEIQVAQGQRKATKEWNQKICVIKEQRELSQLNKELFRQFLQQS